MQRNNNTSDGKNLKILLVGNDGSGKTEFSRKLSYMNKSLTSQKEVEIDFTKVNIEDRTIAVVQTLSLNRFEEINEHAYKANDYQGVVILADDKFLLSETLIKKQKEIPFVNAADYANPEDCITALYEKIKSQEQKKTSGHLSFFSSDGSESKIEEKVQQPVEKKTTGTNKDSSGGIVNFFKRKIDEFQLKRTEQPDPRKFSIND